jgi:hypothetical protein
VTHSQATCWCWDPLYQSVAACRVLLTAVTDVSFSGLHFERGCWTWPNTRRCSPCRRPAARWFVTLYSPSWLGDSHWCHPACTAERCVKAAAAQAVATDCWPKGRWCVKIVFAVLRPAGMSNWPLQSQIVDSSHHPGRYCKPFCIHTSPQVLRVQVQPRCSCVSLCVSACPAVSALCSEPRSLRGRAAAGAPLPLQRATVRRGEQPAASPATAALRPHLHWFACCLCYRGPA